MDIYCTRCGEPWDTFSVSDDMTLTEAGRFRRGEGCPCCFGKEITEPPNEKLVTAMTVARDLLGDDEDGMAAIMEDFEFMGMLEG